MPQRYVGTVIGRRYRLIKLLGAGGMGAVYRAHHLHLEGVRAIKILLPEHLGDRGLVRRFHREARSLSRLQHENVVKVVDTGETDEGLPFIAMEFLEGEPLTQTLAREGRLTWPAVKHIAQQTCSALQAAHDAGIIHRDIKPDNCFRIRSDDPYRIKIIDFGIAQVRTTREQRLTTTGGVIGTVPYMSYEQVSGMECDHRSDIWSVAVLLYKLLTGRLPFRGMNSGQVFHAIVKNSPEPVSGVVPEALLPPALDEVIGKALEKNLQRRFQSMHEFWQALQGIPDTFDEATTLQLYSGTPRESPVLQMLGRMRGVMAAAKQLPERQPIGLGLAPTGLQATETSPARTPVREELVQESRPSEKPAGDFTLNLASHGVEYTSPKSKAAPDNSTPAGIALPEPETPHRTTVSVAPLDPGAPHRATGDEHELTAESKPADIREPPPSRKPSTSSRYRGAAVLALLSFVTLLIIFGVFQIFGAHTPSAQQPHSQVEKLSQATDLVSNTRPPKVNPENPQPRGGKLAPATERSIDTQELKAEGTKDTTVNVGSPPKTATGATGGKGSPEGSAKPALPHKRTPTKPKAPLAITCKHLKRTKTFRKCVQECQECTPPVKVLRKGKALVVLGTNKSASSVKGKSLSTCLEEALKKMNGTLAVEGTCEL